MARRRRGPRLLTLLLLLLLLLLWKLNPFLAGFLPGGGRIPDAPEAALEAGELEVVVFEGHDGEAVAGATIRIRGLDGATHEARTDAQGRARFAGLPAQPQQVEADGPGGSGSAWGKPGERLRVALAPRPTRTGRVRDEQDNPVEADVLLLDRDARILARGRTDASGHYELPDDPRAVAVCAWPRRGAPMSSANGDIVVPEGVVRRAAIYGGGTEPSLAEVVALVPDRHEDRLVPLRAPWSEDGRIRLPREALAYIQHGPDSELHRLEENPHPESPLPRGTVVDERGEPLAGVRVALLASLGSSPPVPHPDPTVRVTGADGAFAFGAGFAGTYELQLRAPGRAQLVIPAPPDDAPIVLPRGFRIGGRVVDADDEPVAGVRVDVLPTPDPDARFASGLAFTADDGRFWVDGVGGDYARVRVSKKGYAPKTMDKVPPDGFVTIRLARERTGPSPPSRPSTTR